MNVDEREWVVEEGAGQYGGLDDGLVYKVNGCAMRVLNELGHGLREKTYERALCVEFRHQGIEFDQQKVYQVTYREEHIDDYIPDLEVEGRLIVDCKTVESICDEHLGQVLNYLRISGLSTALILNFKKSKLDWRKVTLKQEKQNR
jgi:GxxExxY protein